MCKGGRFATFTNRHFGALKNLNVARRRGIVANIITILGCLLLPTVMASRVPTTPLMQAAADGDTDAVTRLIAAGSDPSHSDEAGLDALIWACISGHEVTADALIQRGAPVNPAPGRPHTAIRAAAIHGHVAVTRRLIAAGADVNRRSEWDRTALMGAARGGYGELVSLLLTNGADAEIANSFAEKAIDVATGGTKALLEQVCRDKRLE